METLEAKNTLLEIMNNIKNIDYTYEENALWNMIDGLDWFDISLKSNRNELISEKLIERYTIDEIYRLKNFAVQQRILLTKVIQHYIAKHIDENTMEKHMYSLCRMSIYGTLLHI